MSNQSQFKFLNKGISTPIGILIIVLVAVIAGGIITWQYEYLPIVELPEEKITEEEKVPKEVRNPIADYFENSELQYETKDQKDNLSIALNDILDLSEEQLKEKKYKDYTGKENQWDLPTLIYRHFVPDGPKNLGENFYHDVKSQEARSVVEEILEKYFSKKITEEEFIPLKSPPSPSFIKFLNNAKDVKIDFYYEGDYYSGFGWEPEFYTPEGSDEKFLSLSKLKDRQGKYAYGPDYHSIFNPAGSHWYGGAPIYLLNPESEYSVSYVGFQIDNPDLISELKIEFGIDYVRGWGAIGKSKSSIFASIFGIESVYACGPGLYLRPVGDSNLTFVEESNGIVWYRLEKSVALYDISLNYCDQDCSSMPNYCRDRADDPEECWDYYCCYYNASISSLENGNLRMHILYKPNDKEGFLKLQMVNLILSDPSGTYYQPTMGENFDHYYRAYFH